jgi:VWFA-related protein
VVAVDGKGNPVDDLARSDFQVYDSGQPQQIDFFRHSESRSQHITTLGLNEFSNRASTQFQHVTLILFDLLNQHMDARGPAWNELIHVLQPLESSDGLYLYLLTWASRDPIFALYPVRGLPNSDRLSELPESAPWTRQIKPLLDEAMKAVVKARPIRMDVDVGERVRLTYMALDLLAARMAWIPGRKTIVWITQGVPIRLGIMCQRVSRFGLYHARDSTRTCEPPSPWAARQEPAALGLTPRQIAALNDDRIGRCLDQLFRSDCGSLALAVATRAVSEFGVELDELHNDSTTVTFSGAYLDAAVESRRRGQPRLAITWGHNKDHRPDLPQLKLMAAVAQPTSCPIACDVVPGHRADDILYLPLIERVRRQLQRTGLLYLGDCKMAALGIRADIAHHQDSYLTALPRTGENARLIDTWVAEALAQEGALRTFNRPAEKEGAEPVRLARAREFERTCEALVGDERVTWAERVQLVRTEALAEHHGEQLERRLREAETALHHLTPAVGRGRRQHREEETLREAVAETLQE